MSWIGRGVFRQVLHELDDKPTTTAIGEDTYWWSRCGLPCVTLPTEAIAGKPCCGTCFPDGIPEDYFTHGDGATLGTSTEELEQ
jgi:hypothetical protein